jgi:hypothetical protein
MSNLALIYSNIDRKGKKGESKGTKRRNRKGLQTHACGVVDQETSHQEEKGQLFTHQNVVWWIQTVVFSQHP